MNIDERIKLIKEVGEEVTTENELKELFKKKKEIIAYDGFEPSGKIHIAQGLLRAINVNKITKAGVKMIFLVADWFALMNNKLGGDLKKIQTTGKYFIEVWKACEMNLENVEFVWASDLVKTPGYWETVIGLAKEATIARVMRCGQIMGREESTSNPAVQILYPIMQATDIHFLNADITQLGMDQRKVNMLARELFPKFGYNVPIVVSHHMLAGLLEPPKSEATGIEAAIAKKMSKSNPASAIFMTDTTEEINQKFKKAYCPEGIVEDNPVLEYCKYIVFEKVDKFEITRDEKFGGDVTFNSYEELEKAFTEKKLHPMDLKKATAKYIDSFIKPVREHFRTNSEAKKLLEEVESFAITR